jgi:hypothetical protein
VFAAVEKDGYWAVIDGARGETEVFISDTDLVAYYEDLGCTVVPVVGGRCRPPFIISSCVGMTKAVLGIHSWALTPWQLYRYLT